MTSIIDVLKPYITDPLYPIAKYSSDQARYRIQIESAMSKKNIGLFKDALAKHKFSGTFKRQKNISEFEAFAIKVFDTTSVSAKPIEDIELHWVDMEKVSDHELLATFINEQLGEVKEERVQSSILASKEELALKGRSAEAVTVDLTLPASLGRYSNADKEWFKWFVKDDSDNMYLLCKDKSVEMIPMLEGAVAKIKSEPAFWSIFWKNYREEIINMMKQVEQICWELHTQESAAANAGAIRETPIVTEDGDFSALQKIHEAVPKLIMSRFGAKYTYIQSEQSSYLKSISTVVRETSKGTFVTPSEENLQAALSTIIPLIDSSELQTIARYCDNAYGIAIHRVQTAPFKKDLPSKLSDVGKLPGFWSEFFATKLGDQKVSSMYRIAKWITGCLDADNQSRKVLVLSGHGQDGKSLFTSVLQEGFNRLAGSSMCKTLPGDSVILENNTQNGLVDCLDARVLITPDLTKITEYFRCDVIKAITGCDVVTCQVKYRNPIKKNMAGTKIVVCTNFTTYISDTFMESRISPIYFSRTDKGADWDMAEVKGKLLETFPEFVTWCYRYAYATECERNLPHSGDQPLWSDGVDPSDQRETWSIIGRDKDTDRGMFAWRQADENAELLEDDILSTCETILYKSKNERVNCSLLRRAFAKEIGYSELKGKSKHWKMICSKIREWCPEAEVKISHGISFFYGIKLKDEVANKQSIGPSSRRSELETQLPY